MNNHYIENKQVFINDYKNYLDSRIAEMTKFYNDINIKYGNDINKLEKMITDNGYEIVRTIQPKVTDFITNKFDKSCYYEIKRPDNNFIVKLGLKISATHDKPYFMTSCSIADSNKKVFDKEFLRKITPIFNYKVLRAWLMPNNDLEQNDLFFEYLGTLADIRTIDDVNKLELKMKQLQHNKDIINTLKNLD